MTNHPNRHPNHPARNPKPAEVLALRHALGLTQTQAAGVVYCTLNTWQNWEGGKTPCHPAFWELFRHKTRLWPRVAVEGTAVPVSPALPPEG